MAAPVVVQSKTGAYIGVNTATLVLDAAPTPGNLLLAIHQAFSLLNMVTLAGWTLRTDPTSSSLFVHSRIVQAGDGTSYTWPIGSAVNADLTMLEISGHSSETLIGLSDDKPGPNGTTHAAPVIMPPPDSLMVVATRGNQSSAGYTLTSPGWTTHNQGQVGGAIYLGGCYSRPFVVPDPNTTVTYTSSVAATIRYTSFALASSAPVQAMVGQVAVEALAIGVPNASVGAVAIEVLHSGTLTVGPSSPPARGYKLPPRVS